MLRKDHSVGSWTKERRIYLAVGIIACLAGIGLILFPL